MAKVVVSSKVDASLKQQLQEICAETKKNESELVRDALLEYTKKTHPESVRSMSRRLSAVERQLEWLIPIPKKNGYTWYKGLVEFNQG